jgi:hypothetical protein
MRSAPMIRLVSLSAVVAVAVASLPIGASASSASHAKLWDNSNSKVGCGIAAPLPHKPATYVLCSSRGVPRPKHGGSVGDPFVQLKSSGRPQLVLLSQFSYETTHSTKLSNGSTWSSLGVTCKVGKTVTCTNKSGHGFTIGNGQYKSF